MNLRFNRWKKSVLFAGALGATVLMAGVARANSVGTAQTDRFGYAGTIHRYATLADAQAGTNATDTINVSNRDMSIWVNTMPGQEANIVMGSWWYSTDPSGSAGYGNTHGNTGVGFMQLYDADGSTDTSVNMSFSNYDGTYWKNYNLDLVGGNAGSADYSRLSAYDNVNDGGIWHSYELQFTATGLNGTSSGGSIVANNHPTGVTGSFKGVFELTENQTSPANIGYYTADFTLNMTNWAYANRDSLTYPSDGFAPSKFQVTAVPVPNAGWMALVACGLLGLGLMVHRRRMAKA